MMRRHGIAPPSTIDAVRRTSAAIFAFAPINRACVASDAGFCLACGAPQGEPCRQPRTSKEAA